MQNPATVIVLAGLVVVAPRQVTGSKVTGALIGSQVTGSQVTGTLLTDLLRMLQNNPFKIEDLERIIFRLQRDPARSIELDDKKYIVNCMINGVQNQRFRTPFTFVNNLVFCLRFY